MTFNFDTFTRLWEERSAREQVLLVAMGLILVLALIWLLIFRPVSAFKAREFENYRAAFELHREVVASINTYTARTQSEGAANASAQQPLRTVVGTRATANNLAISRVLPDDQGRLNVWVTNVSSASLMAWLVEMAQNDGIVAQNVIMDREGSNLVSAQILLARTGA
ncbi:type II secretion system protein M [Woodsholea maritima]|uniref:type II secretion system protein M n=1 Tax=Woodsholea maritima TaxID=240237 RepID=UPI00036F7839|nr:type II secretion system protein M [Woodsholea maritima]